MSDFMNPALQAFCPFDWEKMKANIEACFRQTFIFRVKAGEMIPQTNFGQLMPKLVAKANGFYRDREGSPAMSPVVKCALAAVDYFMGKKPS